MASSKAVKLTTKNLREWKESIDSVVKNQIVDLTLPDISGDVKTLSDIARSDSTADKDEYNLCYRLDDLSVLIDTAKNKLNEFIKAVDTSVDEKVNELETAEGEAAEKTKEAIDKFKETADEIEQLTLE